MFLDHLLHNLGVLCIAKLTYKNGFIFLLAHNYC